MRIYPKRKAMLLVLTITTSRLVAALAFASLVGHASPVLLAFILGLALFSDFLDGWLARSLRVETDLGRILDLVADKALTAVCLLFAATRGVDLAPLAVLACRDLLTLGMRALSTRGHQSFPTSRLFGALVMIATVVITCSLLLFSDHTESLAVATRLGYWLIAATVAADLARRFCRAAPQLRDAATVRR